MAFGSFGAPTSFGARRSTSAPVLSYEEMVARAKEEANKYAPVRPDPIELIPGASGYDAAAAAQFWKDQGRDDPYAGQNWAGSGASHQVTDQNWVGDWSKYNDFLSGAVADINDPIERQKKAYAKQTGQGFVGGLLNDSYSDPFFGVVSTQESGASDDPAMPGVTMPWAQPWGTPGFGGPNGGGSVGGYSPNGFGTMSAPRSNSFGFGGPFANRNPWSPT